MRHPSGSLRELPERMHSQGDARRVRGPLGRRCQRRECLSWMLRKAWRLRPLPTTRGAASGLGLRKELGLSEGEREGEWVGLGLGKGRRGERLRAVTSRRRARAPLRRLRRPRGRRRLQGWAPRPRSSCRPSRRCLVACPSLVAQGGRRVWPESAARAAARASLPRAETPLLLRSMASRRRSSPEPTTPGGAGSRRELSAVTLSAESRRWQRRCRAPLPALRRCPFGGGARRRTGAKGGCFRARRTRWRAPWGWRR